MSWMIFAIVTVAAYALQAAFVNVLSPEFAERPLVDLLLVVAIVYGFAAPRHEARMAAFIAGFMADLGGVGAFGVHAFAFGVGMIILTNLRESLRTDRWAGRFVLGLIAAVPMQLIVVLHLRFWQGAAVSFSSLAFGAVQIALVASLLAATATFPARFRRERRTARG